MVNNIQEITEDLKQICTKLQQELEGLDERSIDTILDSRDADPFDSSWVEADKALGQYKASLSAVEKAAMENLSAEVRRTFFLAVIRATGSSDLAAYVAEDFEIISEMLVSQWVNPFIASMLNSYIAGRIPDSNLELFI